MEHMSIGTPEAPTTVSQNGSAQFQKLTNSGLRLRRNIPEAGLNHTAGCGGVRLASKHEAILWSVISDWTAQRRGRLYKMTQGLAVPVNGETPIWFGPLKRKFKGFPDLFGFEIERVGVDFAFLQDVPVFCVVEVKTSGDRIKPNQKIYLNWAITQGIRAYVAREAPEEAS